MTQKFNNQKNIFKSIIKGTLQKIESHAKDLEQDIDNDLIEMNHVILWYFNDKYRLNNCFFWVSILGNITII